MEYIVKVSELLQKVQEMANDGMDFVSISLMEPDTTDPNDPIPASVRFEAFTADEPDGWIDYEDIYVAEDID